MIDDDVVNQLVSQDISADVLLHLMHCVASYDANNDVH